MKYLPVKIESDDSYLNNNNVIYDDKIIDLVLRKITYGDWTKLIDRDKFYDIIKCITTDMEKMVYYNDNNKYEVNKNDLCYKYIRYLFDDGGQIKKSGKEPLDMLICGNDPADFDIEV